MTEGRVSDLYNRISEIEADLRRIDDKWQKSVDDIKATIKSEISELKTEQIKDLKERIASGQKVLNDFDQRLRETEKRQDRWDNSAGVVHWMIKISFAAMGAIGTILGYETFNRH